MKKFALKIQTPTETAEQQVVVKWARDPVTLLKYPDLRLLYMINNVNYGGQYYMYSWLVSMGLLPGLPDMHLPVSRRQSIGFWWESKRSDFEVLSIDVVRARVLQSQLRGRRKNLHKISPLERRLRQLETHEALRAAGHVVVETTNAQNAIKLIEEYLS